MRSDMRTYLVSVPFDYEEPLLHHLSDLKL